MDPREKRLAENEAFFREVNERIATQAHRLDPELPELYLCECANADCTFRVTLLRGEYEAVRADPKQFVVRPDHFTPEVEALASKNETYWIVRKTGEEGEYVEQLDPRSR
jgi:hypothetical protein